MTYAPKDYNLIHSNLRDLGELVYHNGQFTQGIYTEKYLFNNRIYTIIVDEDILDITSEEA